MFRRRNSSELPRGYRFVDASTISPDEAVDLYRATEYIDPTYPVSIALDEWDEALQQSLAVVGVRDKNRKLVGLGTLNGDVSHAALSDLMVDPNHQHLGIGRALVKKRVEIADRIGVQRVNTLLSTTNTLGKLYLQLGFKPLDERTYRRES